MYPTIDIDLFSPDRQRLVEREMFDPVRTRIIHVGDLDTPLVPLIGCLRVDRVRMPGVVHEDVRVDQVPLDTTDRPQLTGIRQRGYGLIQGLDGTPMLARAPICDFGMWRKGTTLYVEGEWDETKNPPLDAAIPVPEVTHRRIGVEVGGPAESITRGRSRSETPKE